MTPSYSQEKKTQILLNWASEFNCKWLFDEIKKIVVVSEVNSRLSTPLSVWEFVVSSQDSDNLDEIERIIQEKSKIIRASFAEEIVQMPQQHIVYLTVACIFANYDHHYLTETYDNICNKLNIDQKYPMELLEELFSKKIIIEARPWSNRSICRFSHPSYEEGIVDSWNRYEIQPLFLKIIKILSQDSEPVIRGFCGLCLMKNYDSIESKKIVEELINRTIKDKVALTRFGLAQGLEVSFRKIPFDTALYYIDILLHDRNGQIRNQVIRIVSNNMDIIPYETVNKILTQSLEDRAAMVRIDTIQSIRRNYDLHPISLIKKALATNSVLCNSSIWLVNEMANTVQDDLCKKVKELEEL
jgi:hypothetical protein